MHKKIATIVRKPNTFDWCNIPVIPIDEHLETPQVEIEATAQICYDDEALYVRLEAKEREIRAEYTGPLDMPSQDSCLEFFFCPMAGDIRYFNIEFNLNCCLYLGIGSCLQDLVRLFPQTGDVLCPKAKRLEDGWEIIYKIPADFIRRFFPDFQLKSGKVIRANFYKCGELTVREHELCWNRLAEGEHDFHRSCDFGVLELE